LSEAAGESSRASWLQVVYSVDEEGNRFEPVFYDPTIGFFEGEDFEAEHADESHDTFDKPNAVCIN
jgi:hypothetical protein